MTKEALEKAVARLKGGDRAQFDVIYDGTYKVVYFVVHSIVGQKEATEDIVQDAYVTALTRLDSYESDNFLAWLTTIAKRLALNSVKKRSREVATDFAENENLFGATDPTDGEAAGLIAAAEKLLSPDDFEIVIMCAVAGFKRREVAKIKDMPVSTVTHRYKTALTKLEKYLKGGEADETD